MEKSSTCEQFPAPVTCGPQIVPKSLLSNIEKSLKVTPSMEQLSKAPGIRSRGASRFNLLSQKPASLEIWNPPKHISDPKIVITVEGALQKSGAKWRSVSSDAATAGSPGSDTTVRRTSDPITTSPSNLQTASQASSEDQRFPSFQIIHRPQIHYHDSMQSVRFSPEQSIKHSQTHQPVHLDIQSHPLILCQFSSDSCMQSSSAFLHQAPVHDSQVRCYYNLI